MYLAISLCVAVCLLWSLSQKQEFNFQQIYNRNQYYLPPLNETTQRLGGKQRCGKQ